MRRFVFIFFITTIYFKVNSQVYKAGNLFSAYVDVIPDSVVNYQGPSYNETYFIDINNDSQNDFKILAEWTFSSVSYGGSIEIYPLNVNSFCNRGKIDSVYIPTYSWWWITKTAKPLFIGDTINSSSAIWENSVQTLTCQKTNTGAFKYITDWISTTDEYIGIKYQNSTDTIFGWIRVNIPSSNNCTIKDYSFDLNSIGIKEYDLNNKLQLVPNPTSDFINISSKQNNFQNSRIEIINYLGQTILKTEFKNQIDVSELSSGFYTLRLKDNSGGVITKKFVKE